MDQGCICKACCMKRNEIANKILKGQTILETDRIYHATAKNDYIAKRIIHVNKINNSSKTTTKKGKDFRQDMKNIVENRRYIA